MDEEKTNVSQIMQEKVHKEKKENDEVSLENGDFTHCFENTDSLIKTDDNKMHVWKEFSFPQKIGTEFQNKNPQQSFQQVKCENDFSNFENVYSAHHFTDSHFQIINNLDENMDKAFWNKKPDFSINKQILGKFESDDNIYISENTDQNLDVNVDNAKLVQIINIKQETQDHQEQIHVSVLEDKNDLKYDTNFRNNDLRMVRIDLPVKAEIYTSDLDGMSSNCANSTCGIVSENGYMNIDLKPDIGTRSNEDTEERLENNGPFIISSAARSDFHFENNDWRMGMNFKFENNDPQNEHCDLQFKDTNIHIEKGVSGNDPMGFTNKRSYLTTIPVESSSGNHIFEINNHLQPIVLLKKLPDTVFNLGSQVCMVKNHMTNHTTARPYRCNICNKEFKTMNILRVHITRHSSEMPHQCNLCEKRFKTLFELSSHMIRHNTERPYQCHICEKRFKTMVDLRGHMTCHSSERPHQCNLCGKGFKRMQNLREHMNCHDTEKPHQCNFCEKRFTILYKLSSHMISHSTERPYQCNLCGKGFKRKCNLKLHLTIHSTDRLYQCTICEKRFKNTNELKLHLNTHSTERPHQCDLCEKRFKTKPQLKLHLTIHSTDRPYQCNICEKRFKNTNERKVHQTTHSTEKPFQCNLCEKGFKRMTHLRVHMSMTRHHSTDRPHQCYLCKKGFKTMGDLKRHIARHSINKQHRCNICKKEFKTKNELSSHMTRHTTARPYQCNICYKEFKTMTILRVHMTRHNSEK